MLSRKIEHLDKALQPLAEQFVERCKSAGVNVLITTTYRSNEEQARLYAQGRTAPGKIVTKAKPGTSRHNRTVGGQPASTAFDFVPLDSNGKAIWDAGNQAWATAGRIAQDLGLEWGGTWKFRDMPHVQLFSVPGGK